MKRSPQAMMIKRELAKDPKMANENWDRFLPKFKHKNVQRRKPKKIRDTKDKPLFPPLQQPRCAWVLPPLLRALLRLVAPQHSSQDALRS